MQQAVIGVRQIDHPGTRAAFPDRRDELLIDRDRPHGAQNAAGTCRITDGLPDAVFFRKMNITAIWSKVPGRIEQATKSAPLSALSRS